MTEKAARGPTAVASLLAPDPETPAALMCSIARSLCVLGERWTFLILREAFSGATRFSEFRDRLGVAPDVLTDRLATLTEAGGLTRELYQEPGRRLQQRGDTRPLRRGPGAPARRAATRGPRLRLR